MRRVTWMLVALALLTACEKSSGAKVTGGEANASCVAPYLNDQPPNRRYRSKAPTVRPGETLTVYGHWYTSTCNDTGTRDPVEPLPPVRLTLTLPGGQTQRLGMFTPAGRDMGFTVPVRIPAATRAGTATTRDDRAPYPASYQFEVGA